MKNNTFSNYLRSFGYVIGIGLIISLLIYLNSPSVEFALALTIAPVVAGLNALIGMHLIRKTVGRSQIVFLKYVLGGMMIRLLSLGAIIALIYLFFTLHFLTFVIALMAYYFALLILEVVFIYTHANEMSANKKPEPK